MKNASPRYRDIRGNCQTLRSPNTIIRPTARCDGGFLKRRSRVAHGLRKSWNFSRGSRLIDVVCRD